MRRSIVSQRHPTDRDKSCARQRRADAFRSLQAIRGRFPRADHGDAGRNVKIRPSATHIQHHGRVRDRAQPVRIGAVAGRDNLDPPFRAFPDDPFRFRGVLIA